MSDLRLVWHYLLFLIDAIFFMKVMRFFSIKYLIYLHYWNKSHRRSSEKINLVCCLRASQSGLPAAWTKKIAASIYWQGDAIIRSLLSPACWLLETKAACLPAIKVFSFLKLWKRPASLVFNHEQFQIEHTRTINLVATQEASRIETDVNDARERPSKTFFIKSCQSWKHPTNY